MRRFFEKYKTSIAMTIATLLLGLLIGVQVKDVYKANEQLSSQKSQSEMYEAMLGEEQVLSQRLTNKLNKAVSKNEKLLKRGNHKKETKKITKQLDNVKFLAGLTAVKGSGVIITLNDASKEDLNMEEEGLSDHIIHYSDVIRVLNTLKANGAQAISINDERILNTSSIICSGSTISINENKYVLPYVIKAIGEDQQLLYESFISSEIYNELVFFKMKADIVKENDIIIKAGVIK